MKYFRYGYEVKQKNKTETQILNKKLHNNIKIKISKTKNKIQTNYMKTKTSI